MLIGFSFKKIILNRLSIHCFFLSIDVLFVEVMRGGNVGPTWGSGSIKEGKKDGVQHEESKIWVIKSLISKKTIKAERRMQHVTMQRAAG